MGEMKNAYRIRAGNPDGKRPPRTLSVDGRIILK
jgi:hypothetical protein